MFFVLQLFSLFVFIVLLSGIFHVIKDVFESEKGFAFNLGYSLAAILVLSLLFWLNVKLYKFSAKRVKG